MKLTPRAKRDFYHQLGKLIASGLTAPEALERLALPGGAGSSRALARSLAAALSEGKTLSQAFADARPAAGPLEIQTVAACERSGHLDRGFAALAKHYETIENTRKQILSGLAYPAFLLHFAVVVLGFASSVLKKTGFLIPTLSLLGALYLAVTLLLVAWFALVRSAAKSTASAGLLAAIPGPGWAWARFALARFLGVLEMQLGAGINLFQALAAAGAASADARLKTAAARIARQIQGGERLGTALSGETILPATVRKEIQVGEDSGKLDEALERARSDAQEAATAVTKATAEWLPRLVYLTIVLYVAYRIVSTYAEILQNATKAFDEL